MSNTTENYYKQNFKGILPSTNSIEIPNSNLVKSMTQIRKGSEGQSSRGRHVIGSERFDMRGQPMMNYQAQNPLSPFRGTSNENRFMRPGITSTSTSTSLNKHSFRDSSKKVLDESGNFHKNSMRDNTMRTSNENTMGMKELNDLDVSPEKRYIIIQEFQGRQNFRMVMGWLYTAQKR